MSRYDGLIIPRSYNEYINKTDPVAMSQALQLNNVLAQEVAAGNNKAVTSNAVNGALADYGNYKDTRNVNEPPSYYYQNYPMQVVREFKLSAVLGIGGDTYCSLSTYVEWRDASVGITQIALSGNALYKRYSADANTWGQWQEFATKNDLINKMSVIPLNIDGASTEVSINCKSDINEFKTVIVSGWITATGQIFDIIPFFNKTGIALHHLGTAANLQYNTDTPDVIKITNTTDEGWKDFKGRVIFG